MTNTQAGEVVHHEAKDAQSETRNNNEVCFWPIVLKNSP